MELLKWQRKSHLFPCANRPLPFLNDKNKITPASAKLLGQEITFEFTRFYTEYFSTKSSENLEIYYAILKSELEVWNTLESGEYRIKSSRISIIAGLALGSFIATYNAQRIGYSVLGTILGSVVLVIITILITWLLDFPLSNINKGIATKKAKAQLFMTLIENVLKKR